MERDAPKPLIAHGATVEFRHVTKQFEARRGAPAAVHDLSLVVAPGEICVLVGPSGCGKTTTLKMVNRLVEPTSGDILIDDRSIRTTDVVSLRRSIGYVIQQTGLFPHQTIMDNVATVPRLLKWDTVRIRTRVDELLELVGLEPARVRHRYPNQLSGGERQRVGVARALAAEPPLMLMDEPFGAVDPIVRAHLQDEFLRIQRRIGMTILFVTHDIDEAIKMGDRVAVFQQGGLLAQYSTPATLLTQPASEYVARFVGGDRALKRLAVMTVDQIGLDPIPTPPARIPVLRTDMTARDALAILLTAEGETGAVYDEAGSFRGTLTVAAIGAALRGAVAQDKPPADRTIAESVP